MTNSDERKGALDSLKGLIILFIIGATIAYVIHLATEFFFFNNTDTPPRGNSTFVVSYNYFRRSLSYFFNRILINYFNI